VLAPVPWRLFVGFWIAVAVGLLLTGQWVAMVIIAGASAVVLATRLVTRRREERRARQHSAVLREEARSVAADERDRAEKRRILEQMATLAVPDDRPPGAS
jgi:membrane protein implicated in regulation of membrane protease activity